MRFKISLSIIVLLLVTSFLFTILMVQTVDHYVLKEVLKRAESLGKSMAAIAAYNFLAGDLLGLDTVSWKFKEANRDVEYVAVTNLQRKILTHSDISKIGKLFQPGLGAPVSASMTGTRVHELKNNGRDIYEVATPMLFKDKRIGDVIVGINKAELYQSGKDATQRIFAGLAMALFLGIGCIIGLSSFIAKPIKELSKGVEDLKMGRRSKLRVYSKDELGKLTVSFNQLMELTDRQRSKLSTYAKELEEAYLSSVKVLTAAIDARDPYTLGHSTRVAKIARKIGECIGLQAKELEDLEIGSLFHDVGKLKTPDYILLKEGPLDPMEHREIVSHCDYGAAILSRASSLQKYIPAVRHHHEWFNGEGYPDGLSGDNIPLHAAIISIADAFDAMTSDRPYKNSLSQDEALLELSRFSGTQFNPWLIEVFRSTFTDPLLTESFHS